MEKKWFSRKEAAAMLKISTQTLIRWEKEGHIKAFVHPINRYRKYSREEVDRLLKAQEGFI